MELQDKATEFANAIKSTREFKELKKAKAVIDKNKNLKHDVDRFLTKQMEIYKIRNPREAESRIAELNKEFENLSRNPDVDRLVKAGKVFNEMIAKIYKKINDSVESDLKSNV